MSRYSDMWAEVKKLTPIERLAWIDKLEPVQGVFVDLNNVQCIDIDLIQALRNAH